MFLKRSNQILWVSIDNHIYENPCSVLALLQEGRREENKLSYIELDINHRYGESLPRSEHTITITIPEGVRLGKKFMKKLLVMFNLKNNDQVKILRK